MPRTTDPEHSATWQEHATATLAALEGAAPSRIEQTLDTLLAEGRSVLGADLPVADLIAQAAARLGSADADDPAHGRLQARLVFARGVSAALPRVAETYVDRIARAGRGSTAWMPAVSSEAFRLARRDGFRSDPEEACHAALLTWLLKNGVDCTPRPVVSARRIAALHAERLRAPAPEVRPAGSGVADRDDIPRPSAIRH